MVEPDPDNAEVRVPEAGELNVVPLLAVCENVPLFVNALPIFMLALTEVVPELMVKSQKVGVLVPEIAEVPLKVVAGWVVALQVVARKMPALCENVPAMFTSVSNLTVKLLLLIVTLLKLKVPDPLTVVVLPGSPEPCPVNTTVPDVALKVPPLLVNVFVAPPPVAPMLRVCPPLNVRVAPELRAILPTLAIAVLIVG